MTRTTILALKSIVMKGRKHFSQAKYIEDLLAKTSMVHSKSLPTPMACDHTLSIYEGQSLEDHTLYRSVVGVLQYCTLTRLDIFFC